jgi:hypothetical protein
MIDLERWDQWLDQAQPGSAITYATTSSLGDKAVTPEALAVAERAKQAFAAVKVELAQRLRKDGDGKRNGFDYLAIKKRELRVPMANGERWKIRFFGQGKGYYS